VILGTAGRVRDTAAGGHVESGAGRAGPRHRHEDHRPGAHTVTQATSREPSGKDYNLCLYYAVYFTCLYCSLLHSCTNVGLLI